MPAHNTNEERNYLIISTLGCIFGFIIPLIVWLLKKENFSAATKKILTGALNFEITVFIIGVVLSIIPIVGWMLLPVLGIVNLVIAVMAFLAVTKNNDFNFPFTIQLLK